MRQRHASARKQPRTPLKLTYAFAVFAGAMSAPNAWHNKPAQPAEHPHPASARYGVLDAD
jgi:hypothetical protein